jgi:hypothetical protein
MDLFSPDLTPVVAERFSSSTSLESSFSGSTISLGSF